MIDFIWDPDDKESAAAGSDGSEPVEEQRYIPGIKNQTIYAAIACGYVVLATFLHSCTEVWVVQVRSRVKVAIKKVREWQLIFTQPPFRTPRWG